ncbi:MAG: 16S rRNA (guanine(966)-N(2))-methyltransferase RsmD [Ignavibacteria bacterium]|nr:16S rRNA (guanine(966)-N(2))-methyltransferase RsmD [Ignavibacteria bacterium]
MRVVGGNFKGKTFKHKISRNIRPTSDFVREAIFDTLANYINFENLIVLDLFAGTGMLGIEALSRGASFCQFVDNNKVAIEIISSNLNTLNIEKEKYKITFADVFSFLRSYQSEKKFDLVFSDPPYGLELNNKLISHNGIKKIAKYGTIFIIEISNKETINENPNFKMFNKKNYGDTNILFFSYEC